jgi:hypothetical protein
MVSGSNFDHKVLRIGPLSFDRVSSVQWPFGSRMASAFIWFNPKFVSQVSFPKSHVKVVHGLSYVYLVSRYGKGPES